jgi:hypothetical protein
MANAHNDSDRLRCLQNAVNMELHKRGNPHLSVTIGPGAFNNFLSSEWHCFYLGTQTLWIHSTQTSMSLANARECFEIPICFPQGHQSGNYLERLDVINSVILPSGHLFRLYISKYLQSFKSFSIAWEQHQLSDSTLQSAKGFLHLQYLSLCVSTFWE